MYNSYKRFEQINTQKFFYIKERIAMVNLITGPKGSGKTQQIIELANEKVKTSHSGDRGD